MNQEEISKWLVMVYGAGHHGPRPQAAEQMLRANPELGEYAPYAAGNLTGIAKNPLATGGMPPLVALTHSSLARLRPAEFEDCVRALLAQDETDANATRINPAFPDSPLSALYGAAGFNHLPGLTKILLDAGANPNDGESVYHSTETRDLTCLKLLLAAGANPKGTNALNHALDRDDLECVRLLLEAGADPNEGVPALHWAIHRRRSVAHFDLLLEFGANPTQLLHGMITPYRSAMLHGMRAQAARIRLRAPEEPEIAGVERFIAACTAADRAEAEAMQAGHNWIAELPPMALRLLPDMVESGNPAAVKLMVDLGWPIGAVGGDWKATALNLAVFRGDPSLTAYLLEKGASWDERHGYNDNVRGTLSFASNERPIWGGDWVGCARALVAAGMPKPEGYNYPPEVQAVFDSMS